MKKLNIIIGKKQIIIAALLVTLSTAAVLNWYYATGDNAVTVMDTTNKAKDENKNEKNDNTEKYGTTELVSNNNYFTIAKLNKKASDDEKYEQFNKVIESSGTTKEQKDKATEQALKHVEKSEKEYSIENQILGKGFKNCVAYIDPEQEKVNIYVGTNNLDAKKAAQIKDIAQDITKLPSSNIIVTPVLEKNNTTEKK